ncbi:D-2-hydroxyacid dehydrogenase [Shewanella maritima]|uniref:D-2-hydroxyacid dehydrogenase n=1 Tax=Shewanella maritima TaxID=2520507 RepID=UPI003735E752
MPNKLLLLTNDNQHYRELLNHCHLPDIQIMDDSPACITQANIWLAEPALAAPLVGHGRQLQWLQSTFAGVDKLTGQRQRRDYHLTNIKGIFGPLMSEYLFGYLLSHYREHQHYHQQQQQKIWQPRSFISLQKQLLLLLGTGSIAQHIAKTAKHFGMHVTGINQHGTAVAGFDVVDSISQLDKHLSIANCVVSVLPSTPATAGLLNQDRLSLLQDDVVLFNLGRGNVLDLSALTSQLQQKPKQYAVLDVFNQEPLAADLPIWECANATITPHIAAPSFPEQVVEIFCDNYKRWHQQQPLESVVDFDKGY